MGPVQLAIRPLTIELWPALEDLFGRSGASNGCWCMYWRIGPRYHQDRSRKQNKDALKELAASDRPPGLLALDSDLAVGWCELAPRAELEWLAHARHLGPVDDLPVWSMPCFYVRRTYRGRGVTGAHQRTSFDRDGFCPRRGVPGGAGFSAGHLDREAVLTMTTDRACRRLKPHCSRNRSVTSRQGRTTAPWTAPGSQRGTY